MRPPERYRKGYGPQWTPPDIEWLEHQYWYLGKSINAIAQELEAGYDTVFNWLEAADVQLRGRSEAQMILEKFEEKNPNWRGDAALSRGHARRYMATLKTPKICVCCKTSKGRIVVHHIDGNPRNNAAENLQWLCWSCHKYRHNEMAKEEG